ncbi:hypothetical protein K1T73_11965 [Roseovarius sp. SCSIO 43702]|uniref:hypothetical protein n=1 Tax=Roseovarius sp. SCSIO 43702 TaxID=2823043 RepID=UPI001C736B51|nr:hypothetical protein [Roseovarius sp. SCSIO 43702]QYX55793.1 hypothetical protein K1T73_11965 [Roseovarius sp. SCSIO 43702]
MTDILPREVQEGLDRARREALRRNARLRVHDGDEVHRVLRAWDGGFALEAGAAPRMRGLVDLYDGARHVSQCLIVASVEEDGERVFEYKRMTDASGTQPLDFYRAPETPVALLPKV